MNVRRIIDIWIMMNYHHHISSDEWSVVIGWWAIRSPHLACGYWFNCRNHRPVDTIGCRCKRRAMGFVCCEHAIPYLWGHNATSATPLRHDIKRDSVNDAIKLDLGVFTCGKTISILIKYLFPSAVRYAEGKSSIFTTAINWFKMCLCHFLNRTGATDVGRVYKWKYGKITHASHRLTSHCPFPIGDASKCRSFNGLFISYGKHTQLFFTKKNFY